MPKVCRKLFSSLKQYQKQLLQVEQDLGIAQEALSAKEQAFEKVKAQKEALAAQSEDFLQKEEGLGAWKEAIIYAQSLAQEQEKSNGRVETTSSWKKLINRFRKRLRLLTSPCQIWRPIVLV